MSALVSVADRVMVMDHGAVIAEGESEKVLKDLAVIHTYTGESEDDDA